MLEQLTASMRAALEADDLEAARIAYEAIGRLLSSTASAAPVVDLATERRKRGDR